MSTTRVGPRALHFLDQIRRSTDNGETRSKASLIEPLTPKRTREGQHRIIDNLIRRGLVEDRNPADAASYFVGRPAALVVTPFGREILAAAESRGRL